MNRPLFSRLLVGAAIWLILFAVSQAMAAANVVSPSGRVDYSAAIVPADLLPPECAGMTVTGIVVVPPGTYTRVNGGNSLILGSPLNDEIDARGGSDCVVGGGGNDILYGGNGVDYLLGGPGNDTLYGDQRNDFLYGQDGNDLIYGGPGNDTIDGGAGTDQCYGEGGSDTAVNCEIWFP